jgi:hypothetical protein
MPIVRPLSKEKWAVHGFSINKATPFPLLWRIRPQGCGPSGAEPQTKRINYSKGWKTYVSV